MTGDKRSGSALVLAVLFCIALIPMIGLAIDGTNVYMMRNQIATALNAAVLAGNRSLNLGADIMTQENNAQNVAMNTFNANTANMYSNVKMNVNASNFTVIQNPQTMTITVSGTVTATLPLMLMGMMVPTGPSFTVSATSTRRPVNIMLVLDNSGPMYGAPLTALQNALGTAPGASNGFLNAFVKGTDSIGLVTFTSAPYVFIPPGQANGLPNTNFPTTLPPQITNMSPPSFTGTGTAAAISAAYQQLQSLNQPGALNVIVLFTVGLPTGITGNFTGLVTQPTPCSQTVPPPVGVLFTTPLPRFNSIGALADPNGQSVSDNPDLRFAPACIATVAYADPSAFAGGPFLSGIPAADLYGNATLTGPYSPNQNSIDYNDIVWASENALYNAANNIRGAQFPTGNAVPATIDVVLLNNAPGAYAPPDLSSTLLPSVANDPTYPSYKGSQPAGQFFNEPSPAAVQTAFASIAAQVLRLAAH